MSIISKDRLMSNAPAGPRPNSPAGPTLANFAGHSSKSISERYAEITSKSMNTFLKLSDIRSKNLREVKKKAPQGYSSQAWWTAWQIGASVLVAFGGAAALSKSLEPLFKNIQQARKVNILKNTWNVFANLARSDSNKLPMQPCWKDKTTITHPILQSITAFLGKTDEGTMKFLNDTLTNAFSIPKTKAQGNVDKYQFERQNISSSGDSHLQTLQQMLQTADKLSELDRARISAG